MILVFSCNMFSVNLRTFSLVLMWICAVSAAGVSATAPPRTFVLFCGPTDEPIDLSDIIGDDDNPVKSHTNNRSQVCNKSGVSEEAMLFLTGPVSTILMPSFYTFVCSIGVPINLFAVLAFAWGIRPMKPAAIYMLNLALADLLFALMLPFKITYHFQGNNWIFGSLMCRVVTAAFYWNMYCSVLLIACISVDRLLAVVYPIDSLAWRRPRNTVIACVAMWIISFAGSLPLVLTNQTVHLSALNITTCHDIQHFGDIFWIKTYFIVLTSVLFFLPLLVTAVSYTSVIWSLSIVPRGVPGNSRRKRRAGVMALTVLLIFVLCFMPTNCLLLAHYLSFNNQIEENKETPDGTYGFYLMFLCLGSLNCLLDPLAYYFGSSQCQKMLSALLRCQKVSDRRRVTRSSDSYRSSSRMSSRTETSKISSSAVGMDSFQTSLSSQYKKLLI
uniref:Proteinase-activated receptor 1 n=1 Tax=Nothobranchius korthausae TaxID=1143690 RepID=A0A1A8GJ93_9TELE